MNSIKQVIDFKLLYLLEEEEDLISQIFFILSTYLVATHN